MRDGLPKRGPRKLESAMVNLDDSQGPGTHWVAYRKKGNHVTYFDSFGNLQPPLALVLLYIITTRRIRTLTRIIAASFVYVSSKESYK